MSYRNPPRFSGAQILVGTRPEDDVAVNLTGTTSVRRFYGFIVGNVGVDTPPAIVVFLVDGTEMRISNVQAGVPYDIPIKGVKSVGTGMTDVYGLIA